jgi:hypothetical protein
MLDDTFKMPKQELKTFEPLKAGVYQCELADVELKDATDFSGNPSKQLTFTFVVVEEGEDYGRKLWANASLKMVSGTKPSNLWKILCGITGKQYTKEECASSDEWLTFVLLMSFVGKQNLLAVSQKAKQAGGMKNVIDSILPIKSKLPAFDAEKIKKD